MGANAWTPGPWGWTDDNGISFAPQWRLAPGVLLSDGTSGTPGGDSIDRANARLISAAPDLVEAVERAIQFIENGLETRHVRMPDFVADPAHDTLPILRAALAKARGEQS